MEGLPNGGFDVTPQIMENINAGRTTATMDQQMFLQGFLPVMAVAFHQRYGLAPSSVNTGTAWSTSPTRSWRKSMPPRTGRP